MDRREFLKTAPALAAMAAWFHNCDKPGLAKDLNLRPEQRVLFAQTVGYPAQ